MLDLATAAFTHDRFGDGFEHATKFITSGLFELQSILRGDQCPSEDEVFKVLKAAFEVQHNESHEFKHLRVAAQQLVKDASQKQPRCLNDDEIRTSLADLYSKLHR